MYLDFRGTLRNMIALPATEQDINTYQVRFWTRPENFTSNSCGTFEVGYIANLADTTTFTPVASYTYSDFTAYEEKEVSMAGAPTGAYIAFLHKANSTNFYWYVDSVVVEPVSSCPRPTAVAVTAVTVDEVTFSVSDPNNYGTYHYALYVNDTLLSSESDFTGDTYTIPGLPPNTAYRLTIATACGDTASGTVATTFRTACEDIISDSLPWTEGFENLPGDTYSSVSSRFEAPCWDVLNRSSANYPYVNTNSSYSTYSHTGSNSLCITGTASAATVVILPAFEDAPEMLQLDFWLRAASTGAGLEVGVITNPTDASTFVSVATCIPAASSTYEHFDASFPGHTEGRIALRYTGSSSVNLYLDDLTVQPLPSCVRPTSVAVSGVTSTSATIEITDLNNAGLYSVVVGSDSTTIYDYSLLLDTLSPNTTYTAIVRTICSDGTATDARTVTFTTPCASYALPYTTGFETDSATLAPACWIPLNGTIAVRANTSYSTNSHEGSNYLDFRGSLRNMVALPLFDQEINTLQVRFWTRPESFTNANCGTFEVGYLTNLADTTTFTAVASYTYSDFTAYEEKEVSMAGAPDGAYIAFLHKAGTSGWYWYVDDVTVEPVSSCPRPNSITITDILADEATLVVHDPSSSGSYHYTLFANDTAVVDEGDFSDTATTFTALVPSTIYKVVVVTTCGSDSSRAISTSFRTACGIIPTANLPWSEGFEGYSAATSSSTASRFGDPCWMVFNRYNTNYPYVMANSSTATYSHSGVKSLNLTCSSPATLLVLPIFESNLDELQISFWARTGNLGAGVEVGVLTDTTNDSSFVSIASCSPSVANEYQYFDATFAGHTEGRIALRYAHTGYGVVYLDDITVKIASDCIRPSAVMVSGLTPTEATFTIVDTTNAGSYSLVLNSDTIALTTTTLTVDTLSPNTAYTVSVRTVCSDGTLTEARTASFHTPCTAIDIPYSIDFESEAASDAPSCWIPLGGNVVVRNSSYNAHASSYYLDFRGTYRNMIALPLFNQGVDTLQVRFWTRPESFTNASCGTFEVGYLADLGDTATFTALASYSYNEFSAYEEKLVPLAGAPAGAYIAFLHKANATNYYWYVDDLVVEPAAACPRPQSAFVTDVTPTAATLHIVDTNAVGNYSISLIAGTDTTTLTATDSVVALTSLLPATSYNVEVRAICADASLTSSIATSFMTECELVNTFPYTENFDSWATGAAGVPSCWNRYYESYAISTTSYPYATSDASYSGSNSLAMVSLYEFDYYEYEEFFDYSAAFMPEFDTAISNLNLSFWYKAEPDENFGNMWLAVGVSETTSDTSTFTRLLTVRPTDSAWHQYQVDFSAYTGNGTRITFVQFSEDGNAYYPSNDYGYIDDITITLDTTAPAPTTYTVTLASADAAMGSVSPAGNTTVVENGSFTATATANAGYRFVAWTDATGATVSTANPYTFTVTANTALTATFEATVTMVTVSVTADETMGSVLGAGTYTAGAQVTLTATANAGYHFVAWMDGATQVSTANPYVFTATADVNLSAIFAADGTEPDQYTVTVNYDATRGTVTGAGTYLAGTSITLVATSNPGYRFAGWSNGVADSNYTFTVTENITLTANFEEVVGIDEVEGSAISLYPNPATTSVTLSGLEPGAKVTIVDLNGREVLSLTTDAGTLTADVSGLTSGAYFVRIAGERQAAVRKLIVK